MTDVEGVVNIDGLPAVKTSFIALAPDGSLLAASRSTRLIPNGQSIRLVLRTGIVITGSVLNRDGSPAPGARVEATAPDRGGTVTGTADKHGRFSLRVPEGEAYALRASLRDPVTGDFASVVVKDVTSGDVELRLR